MVNDNTIYDEISWNWKGVQWPGFLIFVPTKVFSRFLAMSEIDKNVKRDWS